ncbi:hypothetical protein BU018_05810 [Staphylococcus simulans]|nr:hypothetical protein BU018_05810 [Staphylococcus simulans]
MTLIKCSKRNLKYRNMWIALTILFALLSFVLYMANRELGEELKVRNNIIENLIERNEKNE